MFSKLFGLDRKNRSAQYPKAPVSRAARPRSFRPRLEELEQRDLPTSIINPFQTLDLTGVAANKQITITATPPALFPVYEWVQVQGGPTYSYGSGVVSLNILLGSGDGTHVVVQSTNIETQLTGNTPTWATTNVTVMTNGLNIPSVANIWGEVDVVNPPGYTHLEVRSTASGGQSATLNLNTSTGIGTVSGLTPAAITYQQNDLSDLHIYAGNGGNTFNVLDTGKNSHPMTTTLSIGSGTNTVNVEGTTGALVIDRQWGNDTINVSPTVQNLDNIKGDVSVYGNSTWSALNVDDRANSVPNVYTMVPGLVSVARPNVGNVIYGTLDNLVVHGGSNDNAYNVLDTQVGTTTIFYTEDGTDVVNVLDSHGALIANVGAGNDVVNVEQTRASGFVLVNLGGGNDIVNISPSAQKLDTISGDVFVSGGPGFATLNVDDQANVFPFPYTMTSSALNSLVQRPHMFGIARIHYQLIPAVFVNGGSVANTYNVQDTEGSATTTLNTGDGNDIVNVAQTTGALVINGGNGNDVVNVEHTTGALTITLGSGSNLVNITPAGQDLSQIAGPVSISESGGIAEIDLHDDLFSDNYTVSDSQTTVGRLGAAFNFTYSGISLIHLFTQSASDVTDLTSAPTTLIWP
jgi:hypothetical protein